jgi:hypothetical protein
MSAEWNFAGEKMVLYINDCPHNVKDLCPESIMAFFLS